MGRMARTAPIETETPRVTVSPPTRLGTFAAMSVPYYPRIWTSGLLWNLTRWMAIFLCSYLVSQMTHAPFLVQIVGAAFFAPMFFAGVFAGVLSDRLDRRKTILVLLFLLVPISALMAVVVLADRVQTWMVYPFMLAIGISNVIDMTSRRALVYDLVGEEFLTNALALEMLAMMVGSMCGSLFGGTIIAVLGMGQAFLLIAGMYALAFVCMLGVPARPRPAATTKPRLIEDLKAAVRYVSGHNALISIVGVTIIINAFYFSLLTMVPLFADKLHVSAFWAGLLAAANPMGSVAGTFLLARGVRVGRGLLYVGGSTLAMVGMLAFALAPWYSLAFAGTMLAGFGLAGFATMQSVLLMLTASDEMRGRAMGLLSMGIGVLPFSMLALGGIAEVVGPTAALAGSVTIGLGIIGAWSVWRPEAQRLA